MDTKYKKRVGVLRGGTGKQYEPSIKQGGHLLTHISEKLAEKYIPLDIFVDRDYLWHVNGLPTTPGELSSQVDVVWNTSHPSLASILETFSIPVVGETSFHQYLEDSAEMLKEYITHTNIKMPRHLLLPVYQPDFDGPREIYAVEKAKEIHNKFSPPWIVKSFTPDTSMGVHLAKTFPELVDSILDGTRHSKSILIEEFISDKTATMHSLSNFRNEKVYVLPVSGFNKEEKEQLMALAHQLHSYLDTRHYLKSDFVLHPKRGIYLTSIELSPDWAEDSQLVQAVQSVGAEAHHLIEHILEQV